MIRDRLNVVLACGLAFLVAGCDPMATSGFSVADRDGKLAERMRDAGLLVNLDYELRGRGSFIDVPLPEGARDCRRIVSASLPLKDFVRVESIRCESVQRVYFWTHTLLKVHLQERVAVCHELLRIEEWLQNNQVDAQPIWWGQPSDKVAPCPR